MSTKNFVFEVAVALNNLAKTQYGQITAPEIKFRISKNYLWGILSMRSARRVAARMTDKNT
jgi:hypothetical protein